MLRYSLDSGARRTLVVLFGALLGAGACGFRLQGHESLAPVMSPTYLQSADRYSDFDRLLQQRLREAGVLTGDREAAAAVLTIHRDESGRRILSVSATNVPEEYEIYYLVRYSVRGEGGRELLSEQTLSLTRDYSYDETDVLGKQREEESLRTALARDLVRQVMRRLSALE